MLLNSRRKLLFVFPCPLNLTSGIIFSPILPNEGCQGVGEDRGSVSGCQ